MGSNDWSNSLTLLETRNVNLQRSVEVSAILCLIKNETDMQFFSLGARYLSFMKDKKQLKQYVCNMPH